MSQITRLFEGKWGKVSVLLGLVGMAVLFFLAILAVWQGVFLPEPYYVQLPEFKGRVLPHEMVKPGTFTIEKDFESISEWGEEALLSYGGHNFKPFFEGSELRLAAWRPDPKTPGVFQYAES